MDVKTAFLNGNIDETIYMVQPENFVSGDPKKIVCKLTKSIYGLRIVERIERPLKLYCDNKSAVLYSNNNRSSTKSKHIDIKFLVVKERVQSGHISIEYLGTNSMIADPLTKGLPPKVFHEHTAHMGVIQFEDYLV